MTPAIPDLQQTELLSQRAFSHCGEVLNDSAGSLECLEFEIIEGQHLLLSSGEYPKVFHPEMGDMKTKKDYFCGQFSNNLGTFFVEEILRAKDFLMPENPWLGRMLTTMDLATQSGSHWINSPVALLRRGYENAPSLWLQRRVHTWLKANHNRDIDQVSIVICLRLANELWRCYCHQMARLTSNGIDSFVDHLVAKAQSFLQISEWWSYFQSFFASVSPAEQRQNWAYEKRLLYVLLKTSSRDCHLETEDNNWGWSAKEMEETIGVVTSKAPTNWGDCTYYKNGGHSFKYGFRYAFSDNITEDPLYSQLEEKPAEPQTIDKEVEKNSQQHDQDLEEILKSASSYYGNIKTKMPTGPQRQTIEREISKKCHPSPAAPKTPEATEKSLQLFEETFCDLFFTRFLHLKLTLRGRLRTHGTLGNALVTLGLAARPLAHEPNASELGLGVRLFSFITNITGEVASAQQQGTATLLETRIKEFLNENPSMLARKVCETMIGIYYHQIIRLKTLGSRHTGNANGMDVFSDFFVEKAMDYFDTARLKAALQRFFLGDDQTTWSPESRLLSCLLNPETGTTKYLPTRDEQVNKRSGQTPSDLPWNTTELQQEIGIYDGKDFYIRKPALLHKKSELYKKYGFRTKHEFDKMESFEKVDP